ncbi:MAG: hypothetical protein K1X89_30270 [Myxococcaceae bacterium]|nr:hypothetical protein [Myxococcaceae bacterium]
MTWVQSELARQPRVAQPSARGFPALADVVADAAAPAAARAARAHYAALLSDFGGAWLLSRPLGNETLFFVYAATDGDEAWLELYDAQGRELGGASFGAAPGASFGPVAGVRANAAAVAGPPE